MKIKRFLALFLTLAMCIGMLPAAAFAYYERGTSLDVSAEGKTYSLFTDDYGYDELLGMTFLYVVERDGRYYTMCNPHYTERTEVDSVSAIDITEYYDAETNTFSGIEDSTNIGVMQLQRDDYTGQDGMYLDGDMVLGLDIPYPDEFEEEEIGSWIKEAIVYYPAESYGGGYLPDWDEKADGSGCYISDWKSGSGKMSYAVLDLKETTSGYVFAMRDKSEEYSELFEEYGWATAVSGVKGCLYAAPCGHEKGVDHAAYDAPTCMEKGCREYWYCPLCETYFSNPELTETYEGLPAIPALGHDWGSEKCNNCGRPVPVYSKVTNKTDFFALADDTMYVLVAEYNGKYYTPDTSIINLYYYDLDGDGYADIYNVDENNNGTPDILEFDWNENGIYDFWEYNETEEERKEQFAMICNQYFTNLMYDYKPISLPVKEIKLNDDGTIFHDAVKDALEFEMIKLRTSEELDQAIEDGMPEENRYRDECVMQFAVPNTFIGSPCFNPSDREYGQRIQDQGDTYYWSVLFRDDKDSYLVEDWETGEYSKTLEFPDTCKEGSLALCKSWQGFDGGDCTTCLRLRDYNGELSFVVGDDYYLEGSEELQGDDGEWYVDTHDKQACVYLYASAPYEASHVCDFGDWVDDIVTDTHTRTCLDPECGKTETKPHDWDDGVQNGTPTCTEDATVTYTCAGCGKTKTETVDALGHDWSEWTDDGENSPTDTHSRACQRDGCDAAESESHGWSRWVKIDERTHKKSCFICDGTRTAAHTLDAGVVTEEATHLKTGVKTFTCTDLCGYYYTEDIPKTAEHEWGTWFNNNNNGTHSRSCLCGESETEKCTYGAGVITTRPTFDATGIMTYTCTACGGTKNETLGKLVKTDEIVSTDNTEIKITVPKDSTAVLYENAVLVVEEVEEEIAEEVLENVQVVVKNENAEILASYDISLILHGETVQPDGTVEVTLPALENSGDYKTLQVVYIDDEGNVTLCETRVNADGTITFVTDHFSKYAIVGVHNTSEPDHTHHMTSVAANPATCTKDGNNAYYVCSGCSKWFADATGSVEITDQNSVVIGHLGHDYTKKVETNTYLKATASNCTEYNVYWYACSRCDANAKDDASATDKHYTGTSAGNHSYADVWSSDAIYHWYECSQCHGKKDKAAHTAGDWITDTAATETTAGTKHKECTVCKRVLEIGTIPTPATATADFETDPVAALALLNAHKTGTEDSTWDASTKTLTLNGVNFVTTDFTAMELPAGAKIVLNGENTITGGDSGSSCYGIYVSGFVYIEGSGKLTVTAGNSTGGISCGIKATGVVVNGGDVTAKGGTAKTDSYGISNSYSMVIKKGVKVTAIGGTAAKSIGVMNATMKGGTLIASGDTQALENAPEFDGYSDYWWRTSDSASYTASSVTPYTYDASQKYAEFRDTDPSTPSTTYTVTFNANGGTGTMTAVTGVSGSYTLPANGFTAPEGKQFKGWATSADGPVISGTTVNVTAATTLYAIWENVYAITVTDGKATVGGVEASQAAEGASVTLTANAAPEGKVFDKWEIVSGSITLANESSGTTTLTMPAEAVSVKATYKAAPHTHTFDQSTMKDAALKTAADCTHDAVYYKSCSCGAISTTETFTAIGSALGHDYTKKVENNTYLKTAASNCTEYNVYWYACSRCDANAKDDAAATDKYYTSTTAGDHSFTEKLEDAAHYVAGTGTNCQSVKKYYYDCAYCDQSGTTTWDSTTCGPHDFADATCTDPKACKRCSATEGTALGHEWKDATCIAPKTCERCGATEGTALGHDYADVWSSDATNHWHECSQCHEKKDEAAHTAGDWITDTAATETTAGTKHKECTVCKRVLEIGTILAIGYTIIFDANGGSVTTKSVKTNAEGKLTSLPTPIRSGSYSFDGWYTAVRGGTKITTDYVFSANTTVYAHWIYIGSIGIGGGGGGSVSTYAITVGSAKNGTVTTTPETASKGTIVTLTAVPDKGYTLETITVTDKNGNEIKLTNKGDGEYTFTMPASNIYLEATFMEDNSMLNFFVDVPTDAYYYDAVLWAAENGITSGTGDGTTFSPDAPCTRAQVVTFLWRAAGCPAPKSSENPFTDAKPGTFYYDAMLWAVENGITNGTGDGTTFSPDAVCSRAQIVTFLWRSQKSPAADSVNPFTDVAADAYYANAVLWAVTNGITDGTSDTTFSPVANCTRVQIVTFLYRCLG